MTAGQPAPGPATAPPADGRRARLVAVLVANLALVGALLAVGLLAHSVGVWAEGADDLADAAGIGVALLAIHLAARPPTARHPDGHPRATRYAAGVNAGWLLLLSVAVAAGAVVRLVHGAGTVHGVPVLVASGAAAAVMLAGSLLLAGVGGDGDDDDGEDGDGEGGEDRGGEGDGDLNLRAVLLDTAADAAAAGGVAVAGGIIAATGGLDWLDPAVALVISVVVGYHAARLVGRVARALRR